MSIVKTVLVAPTPSTTAGSSPDAVIPSTTVETPIVVVPPQVPPSEPSVALPRPATKRVTFTWVDGIWQAEIELNDASRPFTERDWNQLARTLTVQRVRMRQKANLEYRKLSRQPVVTEPLTSAVKV